MNKDIVMTIALVVYILVMIINVARTRKDPTVGSYYITETEGGIETHHWWAGSLEDAIRVLEDRAAAGRSFKVEKL